ncbi:polyprenyl synthetase family protein [Streptomyces sp. ISL-43]|uniref:polyprenyl synthetase family protein n=1 Tax=Streptomyces sp. ISL-43 TaxID=2819183 RepID=UPI001BEAB45B|nr:polyprenyl synthetase family protein [Streptomyces sp. ISL-43]MBT2453149.1 polyprenyl synthetase family protein [Streptomyces sp. ISL-43]
MTGTADAASTLDLPATRRAVETCLDDFLGGKQLLAAEHGMPGEVVQTLRAFVRAGGKRMRPLLCVCGWLAGGGRGDWAAVVRTAASLELFHTFALIHDDVMDHSTTRRGKPTVHRALAARHEAFRGREAAGGLGISAAVLVGDLALVWADELLHTAGLAPGRLAAVLPVLDAMRSEVMYGQYLDLLATGNPSEDIGLPLKVIRYKTARYTIERPMHIGVTLAGAGPAVLEACTAFALPLGEAFQLRDDVLGVFGDPEQTGKPVLDDLRAGKHTVLIALALQRANAGQAAILRSLVGTPDLDESGAARVRDILSATGARTEVERMIRDRRMQAQQSLGSAPFPAGVVEVLRQMAETATARIT